jgi:hypothetical protein
MDDNLEALADLAGAYRAAMMDVERERASLHDSIRYAAELGYSAREIMDATGLESSKVYMIINNQPCSVPGCTKRIKARGRCSAHYETMRREETYKGA